MALRPFRRDVAAVVDVGRMTSGSFETPAESAAADDDADEEPARADAETEGVLSSTV